MSHRQSSQNLFNAILSLGTVLALISRTQQLLSAGDMQKPSIILISAGSKVVWSTKLALAMACQEGVCHSLDDELDEVMDSLAPWSFCRFFKQKSGWKRLGFSVHMRLPLQFQDAIPRFAQLWSLLRSLHWTSLTCGTISKRWTVPVRSLLRNDAWQENEKFLLLSVDRVAASLLESWLD